jgi:hypothetical protein
MDWAIIIPGWPIVPNRRTGSKKQVFIVWHQSFNGRRWRLHPSTGRSNAPMPETAGAKGSPARPTEIGGNSKGKLQGRQNFFAKRVPMRCRNLAMALLLLPGVLPFTVDWSDHAALCD